MTPRTPCICSPSCPPSCLSPPRFRWPRVWLTVGGAAVSAPGVPGFTLGVLTRGRQKAARRGKRKPFLFWRCDPSGSCVPLTCPPLVRRQSLACNRPLCDRDADPAAPGGVFLVFLTVEEFWLVTPHPSPGNNVLHWVLYLQLSVGLTQMANDGEHIAAPRERRCHVTLGSV